MGAPVVSGTPLSESLQRLLRDQLTSFEQLEIVLLLRRESATDWTAAALSEQLRIPRELVETALVELEAAQLIRRTGNGASFRFAPSTAAIADAVEELAQAHVHQHAALLSTMSVNAIARIRSGPMRAFADAFIVRKRKDDG